jgi:serine/threonine protein kinase
VFLKLLLKFINKKVSLFEAKNTNHLCKIIMEYIGEPTKEELNEMLATRDIMSTSIKAGQSSEKILEKRYKKLESLLKSQVPAQCLDLLHRIFELSPIRRISASEALKHPYFCGLSEQEAKVSVLTK